MTNRQASRTNPDFIRLLQAQTYVSKPQLVHKTQQ
jgi:hypothetical protein